MDKYFHQELEGLRMKVLEMAAYAEMALENALSCLLERNTELAQRVIDADQDVNTLECGIDEDSLRLIALSQPVAMDLRFIVGVMRMSNNLESVGDQAVNIAERSLILSHQPALPFNHQLEDLGRLVIEMLRLAVKAFKNSDAELAEAVCAMDTRANEMDTGNLKKVIDYMLRESLAIERGVHTILVSRALERAGDLATNIAETVIFIVKGVDIKHRFHTL